MTKRAFVIGHPIAHSRSPLIHGHWLAEYGIDGSYERIDLAPMDVDRFLRDLRNGGFVGGNVTVPHKESVLVALDSVSPRARAIGAVNTIVLRGADLHGDNTDSLGFMAHLDQSLGAGWLEETGGVATVLGAGGAARAVVSGLLERGFKTIFVVNRTVERAARLSQLGPGRVVPSGWSELPDRLGVSGVLVNATSLGMTGHPPLAVDISPLPGGAVVADIVYAPLETGLLRAARSHGYRTVDGLGMLLHQAVPGFEAWFGVRPYVSARLREIVVADLDRSS